MRWDRSVGGAIGRGLQGSYALLGATAALAGIFRSAISLVVLVVEVRAALRQRPQRIARPQRSGRSV